MRALGIALPLVLTLSYSRKPEPAQGAPSSSAKSSGGAVLEARLGNGSVQPSLAFSVTAIYENQTAITGHLAEDDDSDACDRILNAPRPRRYITVPADEAAEWFPPPPRR